MNQLRRGMLLKAHSLLSSTHEPLAALRSAPRSTTDKERLDFEAGEMPWNCRSISEAVYLEKSLVVVVEDMSGQAYTLEVMTLVELPIYTWLVVIEPEFEGLRILARTCYSVSRQDVGMKFNRTHVGSCEELDGIEFTARKLMRLELYEEAVKKYFYGLELDPDNLEFLVGCAACFFAVADYGRAYKFSQKALEAKPSDPRAIAFSCSSRMQLSPTESGAGPDPKVVGAGPEPKASVKSPEQPKASQKVSENEANSKRCLFLTSWPDAPMTEIKQKFINKLGFSPRVAIKGRTMVLFFDNIDDREFVLDWLNSPTETEYLLANKPVRAAK